MGVVAVHGIVVGEVAYSESSKILQVITEEYGKIGVLSKGCRSLKSKLRSVSSRLTHGIFYLHYKENGLSTLTAVDVLSPFTNILSDITKISYATYLMDLSDQVLKHAESDTVYPILVASLQRIEEGLDPVIITHIVELKYLENLGVRPSIDACSICGSEKQIVTIHAASGGYLCRHCYQNQKIYSDKLVQLVRMFYYVDLAKITKLQVSDSVKMELHEFIDDYYEQYTGLYLKSKQFLQNLKKLG